MFKDGIKSREQGIAILEIAILLPFLLLLVAGLVDIGLPLSRQEQMLDAAKHVSHSIASRSAEVSGIPCWRLNAEANNLYQDYVNQSGINASAWTLTTEIQEDAEEGMSAQVVHVRISEDPDLQLCVLCKLGLNFTIAPQAESAFALLGECRG